MRNPISYLIVAVLLFLLSLLFFSNSHRKSNVLIRHSSDTVRIRDTVRIAVPEPYAVHTVRVDTLFVPILVTGPADTVIVPVALPVEEKEYSTDDYYAVVRGYLPELVRLDLFPENRIIYDTEIRRIYDRRRFGVGIQVGYGLSGNKLRPYAGIGLQYNLWSF